MPLPPPRIGLVLLRAEWFDTVVALPELRYAMEQDAAAMVAALTPRFTLHGPWVVSTAESFDRATAAIRAADLDLLVLCFQVWAEDRALPALLRAAGDTPLAIWCYTPWERPPRPAPFVEVLRGSGPVGTLEGLGVIHNMGHRYSFTLGPPGDPVVNADLQRAARAGQARRAVRAAQIGILPRRNEQMMTTFVDEFRLAAELGPQVRYYSVDDLARAAEALSDEEVRAYVALLQATVTVRDVRPETLHTAARASLALARLAVDDGLDVLSLNDIAPELHAVLGLRPCLYPPLLDEHGALLGIEGDLGAAVAMIILHALVRSPLLFVEFWLWDARENLLAGGHAGPQNPDVGAPGTLWLGRDEEFGQTDRTEGVQPQFVARPGRVTLLQVRGTPDGWQAIVAGGESVGGAPWIGGYPHAIIRPDVPVGAFFRSIASVGSTQHWIMAYGDVLEQAAAACELMRMRVLTIRAGKE